jgi:hypothetical protein
MQVMEFITSGTKYETTYFNLMFDFHGDIPILVSLKGSGFNVQG